MSIGAIFKVKLPWLICFYFKLLLAENVFFYIVTASNNTNLNFQLSTKTYTQSPMKPLNWS